jgi:hypothetical protein
MIKNGRALARSKPGINHQEPGMPGLKLDCLNAVFGR